MSGTRFRARCALLKTEAGDSRLRGNDGADGPVASTSSLVIPAQAGIPGFAAARHTRAQEARA
jgi:hypothetical protein